MEMSKLLTHIKNRVNMLESSKYFTQMPELSSNIFLLGISTFSNVLKEHLLLLATILTKAESYEQMKIVIGVLNENKYNVEIFENFLCYHKKSNDGTLLCDDYYKKHSIVIPMDILCNNLCNIIIDKSFITCIVIMITCEYIYLLFNKKFNEYTKHKNMTESLQEQIILQESNENCEHLFNSISKMLVAINENNLDNIKSIDDIYIIIDDVCKHFSTYLLDIFRIFQ
jgi:hypothetical protein